MLAEGLHLGRQFGVEPVGMRHGRFEIVDHQRLRHAAERPKGVFQSAQKIVGGLPEGDLAVSLAAVTENDAKDMRLAAFSSGPDHRRAVAEIGLRFLAGLTLQAAEGNLSSGQVFVHGKGGLLRRSHFLDQQFLPLLKRARLPQVWIHDLRHTSATLLLSQGVHPKIVQERLDPSQIPVTLDTYSQVLPTMRRAAADQLDTMFKANAEKLKTTEKTAWVLTAN